jgi:hypothetical protein
MKIAIERSPSQIYDRIVLQLAEGFRQAGHHCLLIDPAQVTWRGDLLEKYNSCDWALITNNMGLLSLKPENSFLFEEIETKLAFLHHDAPFGSNVLAAISEKLDALLRVKNRSLHFSIEKADELDFLSIGINCYPISHINSLGSMNPVRNETQTALAFVGHVVPPIDMPIAFGSPYDYNFYQSYRARVARMDHRVKNDFLALRESGQTGEMETLAALALKMQYTQFVNGLSLFQRGAILQEIKDHNIQIYGGDPAWLHRQEQTRFIENPNISYNKPVFAKEELAEIFFGTRINLNITALQFDTGVINRVVDCAAAGGFILTDRKDQLFELTSVAEEISFSTIDELNDKINYYLDQSNESKRRDVARQLHIDLDASCSVEKSVTFMLEKMNAFHATD